MLNQRQGKLEIAFRRWLEGKFEIVCVKQLVFSTRFGKAIDYVSPC